MLDARPLGDREATYKKMVAEQIVAHLKLSNWRFEKGPPLPHHGRARSPRGSVKDSSGASPIRASGDWRYFVEGTMRLG